MRRHTARLPADVVNHVRMGHPFVYREAMPRTLNEQSGAVLELVDGDGQFVARGLYDAEGIVAIRVISLDPAQVPGPMLWHRRVEQAVALRSKLIDPAQTTAYRIINGEGDGIPGVTVDRYGDFLVVQLFTGATEPHLEAIYEALVAVVAPKGIYEQRRYKPQTGDGPRAPAQHVRGAIAPVEQIIRENGRQFVVDVTAPLSTGLFPDLRRRELHLIAIVAHPAHAPRVLYHWRRHAKAETAVIVLPPPHRSTMASIADFWLTAQHEAFAWLGLLLPDAWEDRIIRSIRR